MTTARVLAALAASADMAHFLAAFETRNPGPNAEGSVFLEPQTPESLARVEWREANDPAISAPAVGFVSDLPGKLGIIDLASLDPETPCTMQKGHRGTVEFVAPIIARANLPEDRREVAFTTILLGPKDAKNGDHTEIVWTFFPGSAVPPSTMTPSEATAAVRTVADARALGFDYGKVGG